MTPLDNVCETERCVKFTAKPKICLNPFRLYSIKYWPMIENVSSELQGENKLI